MEFFRPALLSCRLKETSHFRFRKDRKDRDTVSVRRRKHFPDSVAESEDFLFSRKRLRRVRAWSHRGSKKSGKGDNWDWDWDWSHGDQSSYDWSSYYEDDELRLDVYDTLDDLKENIPEELYDTIVRYLKGDDVEILDI